ncbi:MAG TPA: imidazole glycerol phosphate synthase subunit HisH [Chloroflexi bacterium]|nr:imidazole glycerol phosphate synthase subunit HisH [Chloroflexota bacterium]
MPKVAIVDYGVGNLRSVERALARAGAETVITPDPRVVAASDAVVLPGVGAFAPAAALLLGSGLGDAVREAAGRGRPVLGVCLGFQLLFEASEEGEGGEGLGLLPGRVRRIDAAPPLKVPHMGWNACRHDAAAGRVAVLRDTPDGTYFYFVHSYFPVPANDADIALTAEHGVRFCAAVARDNLFACQFHPEKSQRAGLALLSRFVAL